MKILLAVPSKNRVGVLLKNTYKWLCLMPYDFAIFVEPQDLNKYSEIDFVVPLRENNKGLGYAKKSIQEYAQKNGYDLVFKIDDDIQCFTDFRTSLTPEKTAEHLFLFIRDKVIPLFEKHEILGAVTFPYSFEMYDKKEFAPTKRVQTSFIVRADFLASPYEEISVFEDFSVGLQILTSGFKILKYGMIGIKMGIMVGAGTGGHQSFDRKKQAEKEVLLLRKIYPALKFRKVNKPWEIEPDISSVKL